MSHSPCEQEFVASMRPLLEAGNFDRLVVRLQREWPNYKLRELLFSGNDDAAKVALFCLSLAGTTEDSQAVSCMLRHGDSFISRLAENTMWSIWFRSGGRGGRAKLRCAVQLIGEDRLEEAKALLDEVIAGEPEYAEAYHQRGMVHFLLGRYARAGQDLLEAVRLSPMHFAAMAGAGHCCAATGNLEEALSWYQRAARLHPRAEGLQEAINEVNTVVDEGAACDSMCPRPQTHGGPPGPQAKNGMD